VSVRVIPIFHRNCIENLYSKKQSFDVASLIMGLFCYLLFYKEKKSSFSFTVISKQHWYSTFCSFYNPIEKRFHHFKINFKNTFFNTNLCFKWRNKEFLETNYPRGSPRVTCLPAGRFRSFHTQSS
jgi:hypothetical protein